MASCENIAPTAYKMVLQKWTKNALNECVFSIKHVQTVRLANFKSDVKPLFIVRAITVAYKDSIKYMEVRQEATIA